MTKIRKLLKQAIATSNPSGGLSFNGLFGGSGGLGPGNPRGNESSASIPAPPSTNTNIPTYDASTQVALNNPVGGVPNPQPQPQQQLQPQQPQQTTTSGNSLASLFGGNAGGVGTFLRNMVLPAGSSNQAIGQWFGSPMGRMAAPLIGMSGPLGIPAISWLQQMMSGNMSRWNTLTGGPGTPTGRAVQSSFQKRATGSYDNPFTRSLLGAGSLGPQNTPNLAGGPGGATIPNQFRGITAPQPPAPTNPMAQALLQAPQQAASMWPGRYNPLVILGAYGIGEEGLHRLVNRAAARGVNSGRGFFQLGTRPWVTRPLASTARALVPGAARALPQAVRPLTGLSPMIQGMSRAGQAARGGRGLLGNAANVGRMGGLLGGAGRGLASLGGRVLGPAALAVSGGLEMYDMLRRPGGLQRAFSGEGIREFDNTTSMGRHGYGMAALNAISNPIRSTWRTGNHLIYDPYARGSGWSPLFHDLAYLSGLSNTSSHSR